VEYASVLPNVDSVLDGIVDPLPADPSDPQPAPGPESDPEPEREGT
jgi:hypothetical protein